MRIHRYFKVLTPVLSLVIIFILIQWKQWNHTEFSLEEAKQRIRDGKYDVIVDVRTPEEWALGHHPDAISVPIGEFVTEFPKRVPNQKARILFVCKKGIRAPAAALMARKKGYHHVHAVIGEHNGLM